jgi:uncharacterized protein YdeI (YjbR/CyaY-like superfamily)
MIEDYFQSGSWQKELQALRALVLSCGLQETFKWKAPCYTSGGRNIVLLGRLKNHVVLSFFKGALLPDDARILERPGENTRSGRVVRLRDLREVTRIEPILKRYIQEAIQLEKSGKSVPKDTTPLTMPDELQRKLRESHEFRAAFEALTPGRQRGYCLHFSAAKRSETRIARIERYADRILDGKGLNDCTCGLSKKMPQCDGSHKLR